MRPAAWWFHNLILKFTGSRCGCGIFSKHHVNIKRRRIAKRAVYPCPQSLRKRSNLCVSTCGARQLLSSIRLERSDKDCKRQKLQTSKLRSPVSLRCVKNCWLLSKTWRSSMVSSTMASLAIALRGSSENRRCAHNLGREENAGFSAASAAGRIRTRVRQVCWI